MKDLIKTALAAKKASKSNLVKVGCAIEDSTGSVFSGFNGHGFSGDLEDDDGKTKPGVIHAEADAIAFACKMGTLPLYGAKMVVTTAPCMSCAALIAAAAGIKEVYYIDRWWDEASINMLLMKGIKVVRLKKRSSTPDTTHVPVSSPVS